MIYILLGGGGSAWEALHEQKRRRRSACKCREAQEVYRYGGDTASWRALFSGEEEEVSVSDIGSGMGSPPLGGLLWRWEGPGRRNLEGGGGGRSQVEEGLIT